MVDKKIVHKEHLESFTDASIQKAKERGHIWVRRNLLIWPHRHDLMYRIRSNGGQEYLEFFFVSQDDPVGPTKSIPPDEDDDDESVFGDHGFSGWGDP